MNVTSTTTKNATAITDTTVTSSASAAPSSEMQLPPPLTPNVGDDLATSLALMMMQHKLKDRETSDQQSLAAQKSQTDADNRKVADMRQLADDTRAEAITGAICDGVAAVATAASSLLQFRGDTGKNLADASSSPTAPQVRLESLTMIRDAGLVRAGGESFSAAGKLFGGVYRGAEEDDRKDMAVDDADVDRAKAAADNASTQSKHDDDDMRDTLASIRQYVQATTQMRQAAIMRA